jgi:enamine deaminase RidA (YjgF/YER057c/UK114 family)
VASASAFSPADAPDMCAAHLVCLRWSAEHRARRATRGSQQRQTRNQNGAIMKIEQKLQEMGIELPDFGPRTYYGANYGKMKPFHRIGNLLVLSGHVPDLPDGSRMFPGRVGAEVSVEQGYAAARQTGINCLAGIRQAIGDLDAVVALVRTLNFVVCAPGFTDPNLVSSGLTDLFADVFGAERGIGCRATIGVMSLASNHCFETWMDVECR